MKNWEVTAEINMDASKYVTVSVESNTERKAIKIGTEKIKKEYKAFYVTNISVKEIHRTEIISNYNFKSLDELLDEGKSLREIHKIFKHKEEVAKFLGRGF